LLAAYKHAKGLPQAQLRRGNHKQEEAHHSRLNFMCAVFIAKCAAISYSTRPWHIHGHTPHTHTRTHVTHVTHTHTQTHTHTVGRAGRLSTRAHDTSDNSIYMYICPCMYVCMYVCICILIYIIPMYIYIYVYAHVYACVCVYVCVSE
jgi:hypothetical protein